VVLKLAEYDQHILCKLEITCKERHRDQYGIDEFKRFVSHSRTTDFSHYNILFRLRKILISKVFCTLK